MKKKYRALRTIAFVMQVLAWLTLVLAILGGIGALVAGVLNWVSIPAVDQIGGSGTTFIRIVTGVVSAIVVLVVGFIGFILLLAGAETIYVTLDLESNTRMTAEILQRMAQQAEPPPANPPPALDAYSGGETITQDTPAA